VLLREEQGWTQQYLAKKSDVSYGSIKRFERSGKIAVALGRLSEFDNMFLLPKENKRLKQLFES